MILKHVHVVTKYIVINCFRYKIGHWFLYQCPYSMYNDEVSEGGRYNRE